MFIYRGQYLNANLHATAKFVYASELVLAFPQDVAKQLRLSLSDSQKIIDGVCNELSPVPRDLEEYTSEKQSKFTTGDAALDTMLGGGIQTGMVWELVGERQVSNLKFYFTHYIIRQRFGEDPVSSPTVPSCPGSN